MCSQPLARSSSRTAAALPTRSRASRRAASGGRPRDIRSAAVSSRKCCTSSATSWSAAVRFARTRAPPVIWRHTDMSLALRLQQTRDGGCPAVPVCGLRLELLLPRARERIELRAARVLGVAPLGVAPAGPFQPLQRDEQRAGIHAEHAARDLLDTARDAEAVHRLEAQRLENQHVERALDDVGGRVVHARTLRSFILTVKM